MIEKIRSRWLVISPTHNSEDAGTNRRTNLSTIAAALGSLVTDTDFEEFYRRALFYEIEAITNGLASFSRGDWEEIQEIATLCGWEGGRATSIAMSICNVARDSIVNPLMPCTAVTPRSSEGVTSYFNSILKTNDRLSLWHLEHTLADGHLLLAQLSSVEVS